LWNSKGQGQEDIWQGRFFFLRRLGGMKNLYISTKGQALVLVALLLLVLLALAGLAIDVGMAYGVKAKLNAAVDVAAIAAGRVVAQGESAARTQATNFFNANYPTGVLGSTVSAPETTAVQDPNDRSWTITVSATASVPTNFAKLVGFPSFSVHASATSTRRPLDMILVLDSSGSLNSPAGTPALLRAAATAFLGNFDNNNDRVGLIHFASGVVSDVPIQSTQGFNRVSMNTAIAGIGAQGATTSEEALRMARQQLGNIPSTQGTLRVIVMFTDGAPNGIAVNGLSAVPVSLYSEANTGWLWDYCASPPAQAATPPLAQEMFSLNLQNQFLNNFCNPTNLPATDYTGSVSLRSYNNIRIDPSGLPNTRCNVNIAARNMLENVANAARSEVNPIHIFTIGLGNALTTPEISNCGYGNSESGQNILLRLANVQNSDTYNSSQPEGLFAFAANGAQLTSAFQQVANAILRLSN
jgi:Flp pilus assembly protein TadG